MTETESLTKKAVLLLAKQLDAEGKEYETVARLWETDPKAFGTDSEAIAHSTGVGEGLKKAAAAVRNLAEAL